MSYVTKRGGEAAPIGDLIKRIEREISACAAPSWPVFGSPGELKTRLLRAIGIIQRHSSHQLGVSRAQLRHLASLVGCAAREDLAVSGGMLGASNDYYASRLGVLPATITTIFRALKQAGLVEPHNATPNHRRSCHIKPDGLRDGRGYSLRPTVQRLDELEALAAQLDEEAAVFAAKRFEVRAILAECAAIEAELPSPPPAAQTEALQAKLKRVRTPISAPELNNLLECAIRLRANLRSELHNLLKGSREMSENRDQTRKKSRQHHTGEQPSSVSVFAWRGSSSGDGCASKARLEPEARSVPRRISQPIDIHSDLSCGLTLAEARKLFPEARDYIPRTDDPDEAIIAASALGQRLRINPRLLGRSFEAMGISRTLWSLHIVSHRIENGQIERDAAAYFNGMVSRAIKGELDIDRSIWGLRGNLAGSGASQ